MSAPRRPVLTAIAVLAALTIAGGLAACGEGEPDPGSAAAPSSTRPPQAAQASVVAIDTAVGTWSQADSIEAGHAAAEEARNLIVGDDNPRYGDGDEDGAIAGATEVGLLPGIDGRPGLASRAANACVEADLLGGSWEEPRERWAILDRAIAAYRPDNNLFPTLPSHAQRVVGWATLALASDDLDEIREYSGHASLHSRIIRDAVTDCA